MTSVLGWAYYVVGVSVLVAAGAVALEAMLRGAGRGGRWAWLIALAVLLLVPLGGWLRPVPSSSPAVMDVLAVPLLLLPPVSVEAAPGGSPIDLAALLPWSWALASVVLALLLLLSYAALRRAARTWRCAELGGVQLWISARTGPAVVGVRRPRIVVPEWVLELEEADRQLMVLHEQEHLRAGDARLLLFGLGACVLLPWNPVAWWALHRLRGAIELDCDARVLARAGEPAAYGRLLLEVGRRRSTRYLVAAAFAEPRVLERRVRALIRWPGAKRPLAAMAFGAAALLCFGFAYLTPQPLARGAQQPAAPLSGEPVVFLLPVDTPPPLGRAPTFTAFTTPPELRNRDEITKLLATEYPPLLRSAGIGGKILVWVFIDEKGAVGNALVKTTSGQPALDSAAVQVASHMRFTPAKNQALDVPVWVEMPIVFRTDDAKPDLPPPAAGAPPRLGDPSIPPPRSDAPQIPPPGKPGVPRATVPRDQLDRQPTFTPFTLAPELTNRDEIKKLLVASYPPQLRSAGIGGKALVWVFIDETGVVTTRQMKVGSGYEALDSAAVQIAGQMRFKPAKNRAETVPVWVEIPIVFTANDDVAKSQQAQRELLNVDEITRALVRAYPPVLRDAGIGGMVQLRLLVGEDGLVTQAEVLKSSGRVELDQAALGLKPVFRFARGAAPEWVVVPVSFSSN